MGFLIYFEDFEDVSGPIQAVILTVKGSQTVKHHHKYTAHPVLPYVKHSPFF